ncbi:MAG: hypothetical protein A2176_08860 [Spirochaetes bacterium RBG_13_51_14]|nr:MAG: hypothetical protein A2176_08860 [Spirochaetes bacterium RBG_13_51_14]
MTLNRVTHIFLLTIFLVAAGAFLPQRAYSAQSSMNGRYLIYPSGVERLNLLGDLDNYSSRSIKFEIMLGVTISYD